MELLKVKKKRSDVSKRIEGNKDTDFVCINMSWNSLCKNNCLMFSYLYYFDKNINNN